MMAIELAKMHIIIGSESDLTLQNVEDQSLAYIIFAVIENIFFKNNLIYLYL